MPSPSTPPSRGISQALVGADDTLVSKVRWNELAGIHAIVGTCPGCGGGLKAMPSDRYDHGGEDGHVTWYEAACVQCGKEVAAPNGRVFRRSSLNGETPRGWLDGRQARDEEERNRRAGVATPDGPPPRRRRDRSH